MLDSIKPGEAYTFAYRSDLPIQGEVQSGSSARYLQFIDDVSGVVIRGGLKRRPARPSRVELEQMGFDVVNSESIN